MALRIGPVGPVREAGLGSGAGLGSEALRRAMLGVAARPLSLPCRRCPPTRDGVPSLRWRRPIPNAAPRRAPLMRSPLVRRRESREAGFVAKVVRRGGLAVQGPQKPRLVFASRRSRSPLRRLPVKSRWCEGVRVVGDPSAGFAQRRAVGGVTAVGPKRPGVPVWGREPAAAVMFALSPLLPRARTGVSPALPWNALGCVGAWAPALSTAGRQLS